METRPIEAEMAKPVCDSLCASDRTTGTLVAVPLRNHKFVRGALMNTSRYSDEELHQAIEHGLITAAYRADPRSIAQELNRLRATEITTHLQNQRHAYMAVSLLAPGLKVAFQTRAAQAMQHAEVLGERIHDLRHTFASLLIQQGESLAYVKDQMGHHSIKMTVDTYGHLVPGATGKRWTA